MRTTFIVDGFNLYHSAVAASLNEGKASAKWLDLRSFLTSCLPLIDTTAKLESIHYFSAIAHHREPNRPGSVARHQQYLECLKSTGVLVELGRFKKKPFVCRHCQGKNKGHEEKETDVAIGVKLLELLFQDECDTAVLVTGDTDLCPAIRTAKQLFPQKQVWAAFPYARKNSEVEKFVDGSFKLKSDRYTSHQFANPLVLPSGKPIPKPSHW